MIKAERQTAIDQVVFRPADAACPVHVAEWDAGCGGLSLLAWLSAEDNGESVARILMDRGAICLRGFAALSPAGFAAVTSRLCGTQIEYLERTTPRSVIDHAVTGVYTSTEYPSDQEIFLHNENAYASHWPEYLCFYCEEPAAIGGETCLADLSSVEAAISQGLARQVACRGLLHRRIFLDGVGVPWQVAFDVATLEDLRDEGARMGLEVSTRDDRIQVEYRHSPYALHPRTRVPRWFNHAAFFQPDKLDAGVLRALNQLLGGAELINRVLYGDGSPLEQAAVNELTGAYRSASFPHSWRARDLLIIDNMRYAHGRRPFSGARRVWVSMANQINRLDLLVDGK